MKCVLLLSIVVAVCTASVIKDQEYREGDRYFLFPGDGDGIVHLVDAEEPADLEYIEEYTRNPNNNAYWLFTRSNQNSHQVLRNGDANSVRNSHFSFSKVTVFLAHGWNGNGRNEMNTLLRQAFLQNGDVNVIVVDWSELANRSYNTAKGGTAEVGRGLGRFVNWLVSLGMSYDRVHLVGFSLGGHLVGNAGRETNSRVRRITALDPAGPLWGNDRNRIVRSDGRYVEVIHTDTSMLGFNDPCGDADFYPNGGSNMPGCLVNSCSHGRAYEYMASTVKHNHLRANQCADLREATRDRCTGTLYHMGNSDLNKSRTGIYRVNTGRNYPF
ncbi:pancreatic lipase-related protein 2-like [Trichoplusia ni]|uniref:Pancreatic lipase-related protein 2-like n=1 Tax=Trichoplusia ni TaxID=7111 RepID=A0A7E5VT26_TRINI|nr:pancreatic lipase-related protein 2-like [Trichoplusia ni]